MGDRNLAPRGPVRVCEARMVGRAEGQRPVLAGAGLNEGPRQRRRGPAVGYLVPVSIRPSQDQVRNHGTGSFRQPVCARVDAAALFDDDLPVRGAARRPAQQGTGVPLVGLEGDGVARVNAGNPGGLVPMAWAARVRVLRRGRCTRRELLRSRMKGLVRRTCGAGRARVRASPGCWPRKGVSSAVLVVRPR